ncbi:MAG: DUF4351 domain-containing protein [Armatimonadota bacterium]|nr:DUF4351 domain-containing protein [Armatimonadota bacterium]
MVTEMRSVYEIEAEKRGIVRGKRDVALLQLWEKFGHLPEQVETQIRAIQSESELNELLKAIIHASSLTELGLDDAGDNGHPV